MSVPRVSYNPAYSVGVFPPAVPLSVVAVCYTAEDGGFLVTVQPVIGIAAVVRGCLHRPVRGNGDPGRPIDPPSAKSLAAEGYRVGMGHRDVEWHYLVCSTEYQAPATVEDEWEACSNAVCRVVPTADLPLSEGVMADLRRLAKGKEELAERVRMSAPNRGEG